MIDLQVSDHHGGRQGKHVVLTFSRRTYTLKGKAKYSPQLLRKLKQGQDFKFSKTAKLVHFSVSCPLMSTL